MVRFINDIIQVAGYPPVLEYESGHHGRVMFSVPIDGRELFFADKTLFAGGIVEPFVEQRFRNHPLPGKMTFAPGVPRNSFRDLPLKEIRDQVFEIFAIQHDLMISCRNSFGPQQSRLVNRFGDTESGPSPQGLRGLGVKAIESEQDLIPYCPPAFLAALFQGSYRDPELESSGRMLTRPKRDAILRPDDSTGAKSGQSMP